MITTAPSRVHELVLHAARRFAQAGIPAPQREAEHLLAAILGCEPLAVYMAQAVTVAQAEQFSAWCARRAGGTPLQYLTGTVRFSGETFEVSPATLIPRPETELLLEAAVTCAHRMPGAASALQLIDIGTGCGNLAICLTKRLPSSRMLGIDRSAGALEVARRNAARCGVSDRIDWMQADGLQGVVADVAPHVVVTNPPYIPTEALAHLPVDVQQEPRAALDGGADGCRWYRAWTPQIAARLVPGGFLVCELGDGLAAQVSDIVRAAGLTLIGVQSDWQEIPRVVIAQRPHGPTPCLGEPKARRECRT